MIPNRELRGKVFKGLATGLFVLLFGGVCQAGLPLITDDTGTQGRENFQFEFSYEYEHDKADGVKTDAHQFQTAVTFGIVKSVDLVLAVPYVWATERENGEKTSVSGFSDMSLEVKWRFYEEDTFSLAVKPGISLPSGDYQKGLGTGRIGGSLFLIATKDMDPLVFHFNAAYFRNENKVDEETDLWHFSFATEYQLFEWLRLVADVGAERNPDKADSTPGAYILGGVAVPVTPNFELSLGAKSGLTDPEPDMSVIAGLTFRF